MTIQLGCELVFSLRPLRSLRLNSIVIYAKVTHSVQFWRT